MTITVEGATWAHVLFAAVICLGGLYFTFRNLHRARIVEDVPTALVRSAAQGYVELEGDAEAGPEGALAAPLTGSPCCWFRYKIEKRNGKDWSTVERDVSKAEFLLRDATGSCRILPADAEVTPTDRSVWYGDSRRPPDTAPPRLRVAPSVLFQFGGRFEGFQVVGGRYRYTEERIYAGDRIYAIGHFRTEGEPERRRARSVLTSGLLRRWKTSRRNLLARFDRNGDGTIDAQEWALARQAAQREAAVTERVRRLRGTPHTLARSREARHPFLISSLPQFELASRYRRYAALSLLPFFGGGVAVVLMLV